MSDVARILAEGLARLATSAPGGTKWPGWTAPGHRGQAVAIVRFGDGNVCGVADGMDPEQARERLADALIYEAEKIAGGGPVGPRPELPDEDPLALEPLGPLPSRSWPG